MSKNTNIFHALNYKILGWELLFLLCFGNGSCTVSEERFSRATIERDVVGWSVVQRCVSEGCYPHADFIVSKDITVRVEALNRWPQTIRNRFLLIGVMFPDSQMKEIEFDPFASKIMLNNGDSVSAKGTPCVGTMFERSFFLSLPRGSGFRRITDAEYCYYLFFDVPPPAVDDVFALVLTGVRVQGRPIHIPRIIFRPGGR